jgi:hypothetical protein
LIYDCYAADRGQARSYEQAALFLLWNKEFLLDESRAGALVISVAGTMHGTAAA